MADTSGRELVQAAASYANGGLSVAYLMGVVNAAIVCLVAFGVTVTEAEGAAVIGFTNTALVAAFHLLSLFKAGRAFGPKSAAPKPKPRPRPKPNGAAS